MSKLELLIPPEKWQEPENISAATMALSGFMILCDWLGSDNNFFPACPETGFEAYAIQSQEQAKKAVEAGGFMLETLSDVKAEFGALFQVQQPARPLQRAIDQIPNEMLNGPVLAVIEAPTGEGKTEAALALAHKIARQSGSDELYYALPTTATSNQMFGRLQNYLCHGLGLMTRVKLVHGQAFLYQDDLELSPLSNGDQVDERTSLEWFSPKKRALLAPFGVGTIDQAELAALNVKHNALRMLGLAGKVVILDEVHAYDVYMSTVIERLLRWLAVMGTSVILLSATLPKQRRLRLAQAYGGTNIQPDTQQDKYPLIWVQKGKNSYQDAPPAYQENRILEIGHLHIGEDAGRKAEWLLEQAKRGGCVCWITNTVQRAQELYREVRGKAQEGTPLTLIHARFPVEERQKLEELVTQAYGPGNDKRPERGIVIGTQVLEQSLDLDFDVMVSDLAPIDLLLQRAGRLHRHRRTRPKAHERPKLWVNYEMEGKSLKPGVDAAIYDEFILRMSQKMIAELTSIELPVDYRRLVEGVYSAKEPEVTSDLYEAWKKLSQQEGKAIEKANTRLLPEPEAEDSFCGPASHLSFEESETNAGWVIAQTRLGEESINVIPLETDGTSAWFFRQGKELRVRLDGAAPREIQLALLRRSMRVSRREMVEALKQATLPTLFTQSYLLKDYMPLFLHDGKTTIDGKKSKIMIELDPELGLCIEVQKGM